MANCTYLQLKESPIEQADFDRAVALVAGEIVSTIKRLGFLLDDRRVV